MRNTLVVFLLLSSIVMAWATPGMGASLPDSEGYPIPYPGPYRRPAVSPYPMPVASPTPTPSPRAITLYVPFWTVPDSDGLLSASTTYGSANVGSAPAMGFVSRRGDQLWCDGQPFTFAGLCIHYLNAPNFPEKEVEGVIQYLSSEGVTAIRLWLLPGHDLDRFERLLDLGRRYEIRFVVTLVDYYFHKDVSWFKGEGLNEYVDHARGVVTRFRDRPEIIAWELMNEPGCGPEGGSQSCLDVLYKWVAAASSEIKALDPRHLISIGTMRAGWTEAERGNYYRMHALDTIDIVSVHKRAGREPLPELETAEALGKPVMIGEVWSQAYKENCLPLSTTATQERATKIQADLARSTEYGIDGYLLWNYSYGAVMKEKSKEYFCSTYGYFQGDPVFPLLREWTQERSSD
jgi:hypothetical protein